MNFNTLLQMSLLLVAGVITAQNNQEEIIKHSKQRIDSIISAEKSALKARLLVIDEQIDKGTISQEQGKEQKKALAEASKRIIQEKTQQEAERLSLSLRSEVRNTTQNTQMIMDKVERTFQQDSVKDRRLTKNFSVIINRKKWTTKDFSRYYDRHFGRTQSGLNIALGFHTLASKNSLANDKHRIWGSKSLEIGYVRNTRLMRNDNLLHLTYGLSWMMDKLKMRDDDYYVKTGEQTLIMPYPHKEVIKSKFKSHYLILPVNLEFDFSEPFTYNGKKYYPVHNVFHFAIGGYFGVHIANKQKVKYEIGGSTHKEVSRKDFNVNPFIYGLSAQLGYRNTVFYARYALSPLFAHNPINEYPFSIGVKFGM